MINIKGKISKSLRNVAEVAFDELALSGDAEVEVTFVSEDEIKDLNARTRNIDRITDVLSYPMLSEIKPFTAENYPFDTNPDTGNVMLGSIAICDDVAKRQAEEYGHSKLRERTYLFLHGLLHLLGYDHMQEEEKKVMREAEERILGKMGIGR